MIRLLTKLVIIALALSLGTTAYGQSGDWYAAGSIVYNDDDGARNTDDSVSGIQFNVGRNWMDNFAYEGVLGYSDIKGWKGATLEVPDEQQLDLAANILTFYNRDGVFAPYVLVGIGYLNVSYGDGSLGALIKPGEDGGALTYTAGLGFKWRLGDSNFSLRGEFRLRGASDPITLNDRVGTLGVEYRFGGKSRALGLPPSDQPADTDGDGVLDMWDECANTPPGIGVTSRGCEIQRIEDDTDDDRVPNSEDACPDTPAGVPVSADGCSLDSDMDGVLTGQDRCPGSRPGADVNKFGCENDVDKDGVADHHDRCLDTRQGAKVDVYGCEIKDIISLPGVNFQTGSDLLAPGAEDLIEIAAQTLNNHPDLNIEVAGHTDSQGSDVNNIGLSDRRAKTVYDYLFLYGVDPARMSFKGYGESEPIADNSISEGRAINRRVELRVTRE